MVRAFPTTPITVNGLFLDAGAANLLADGILAGPECPGGKFRDDDIAFAIIAGAQ